MPITKTIETLFQKYIPSPFVIAILLTLLTMGLALLFTENPSETSHAITILKFWEEGIWNNDLLVFAYQMMLILVLGHVLVLSKPMNWLISKITVYAKDTISAVLLISVTTMLVAFFNWGLGLIFGAIMARKVGEAALQKGFKINYPLVGASGYIGLMIWHGGMSGSAPLKVAEKGHLTNMMDGIISPEKLASIPEIITSQQTIFSWWNLLIFGILLIVIPFTFYLLARNGKTTELPNFSITKETIEDQEKNDKLDHSKILAIGFGFIGITAFFARYYGESLSPNMLNFLMLGLGIILHGNFKNFLKAVEESIGGASGILIQFPLYFGIMGIMKSTGMVTMISDAFITVATETTLPIFTFFSAGLVNVFVPSGGGQWAIQGPIVIESALSLGVPLPKAIMALAYGDQVTNMLQPFWALPLLGITKLKAKEILPYTLVLMMVGSTVYILGLLLL
ncbi:TIGR00366 family protein [uncultured Dokdonia sp.]|mgnify:CR=1 FL=1|uniref:short-chain fatty acid transporter n=1 Tax=uncultured Dokdonia sp. TaxID=575653 RepID=UPI0026303E86|nr:TIGR00366 family protein [uncultured Dokdonia sp.]